MTSPPVLLAATCDDGSATAPNLTPACQPSLPALALYRCCEQGFDRRRGRQPVRRPRRFDSQSGSPRPHFGHPICFQHTLPGQTLCHGNIPRCTGTGRATDSTGTAVVTEQSSTGGVKTALNTATGANQFALGVMSMENTPAPTATADRWAFAKLDRVSPNSDAQQRAEAMDGSYNFWYELAAFTAGGSVSPASAAGAALIAAVNTTLGESDLKGIFSTPAAGSSGPTGKGARVGNSCQPALQ